MASSREIRRRIRSVTNIGQITKAMELVAASRMRRAQETALAGRRYTRTMYEMLQNLLSHTDPDNHPLLRQYETGLNDKPLLMVVFGPDKGLCGALITNLLREIALFARDNQNIEYATMGKKAREGVRKLGGTIIADVPLRDKPRLSDIGGLTKIVIDDFVADKYRGVVVANTHFVSILRQEARVTPLLPLSQELVAKQESMMVPGPYVLPREDLEYLYEPDIDTVLGLLLPRFVEMTIFQSLLEAQASYYSAQMMAMKNAGDNAHELQQELVLTYNQLRQASITAELAEIASAGGE
jgi:F-type H+-transporting ATPase subunit gamma